MTTIGKRHERLTDSWGQDRCGSSMRISTTGTRPGRRWTRGSAPLLSILCAWAMSGLTIPSAAAQDVGPTSAGAARSAPVTPITSAISVDGILDEPEWQRAGSIGPLIQREPATGAAPSEDTEVRLLRNEDYLFIGVVAYDSEPERIVGSVMTRDANLRNEDRIEIILDTYGDGRNAYYFATNPAGAIVDGLVSGDGQLDTNWDAVWEVRTRITDTGWSAEFAIPFKSLSFPSLRSVWGFNVSRTIHRKFEESRWSGARLQTQFLQVSEAGQITNMAGLTQGLGLAVRPFAGGHWAHESAGGNHSFSGKPGVDLSYNFTPSLKLSTTVNTDFGETEVDDRQISLDRHSLLFPEKRLFFLQDSWVFNFSNTYFGPPGWQAPARAEVIPYFSRRIGLFAGDEVPIDYGLRLTGRHQNTELGLLNVRTRGLSDLPADNFFVGRVRQNFLSQSHAGAIFTRGNPGVSTSSSTVGADVRLATSTFLGNRNLVFNTFGLGSLDDGDPGTGFSYGASLEYPNEVVQMELMWRDIQEDFDPALGFVSRGNVRVWRAGAMYNPRPRDFLGIQQMFHGVFYNQHTRLDTGQTESQRLLLILPLDWHFRSGDAIHSFFSPDLRRERLFSPFEISPGVVLPVGDYRNTRWRINAATATRRQISGQASWAFGSFWSGRAHEVQANATFKVPPRFTLGYSVNQTFANLPEGNFIARIFSSRLDYTPSPLLAFSSLLQYDNRSEILGWQSRVRWTLQPGNDLFLVFNRGWIRDLDDLDRLTPRDSRVSAKLQYTLQF